MEYKFVSSLNLINNKRICMRISCWIARPVTFFHTNALAISDILKVLPSFIFQCYRPQTWQFSHIVHWQVRNTAALSRLAHVCITFPSFHDFLLVAYDTNACGVAEVVFRRRKTRGGTSVCFCYPFTAKG